MATIDVDLDEFDTDDILSELKTRLTSKWQSNAQRLELREKIKNILNIALETKKTPYSLADEMKLDLFLANIDKIKQEELEQIIK